MAKNIVFELRPEIHTEFQAILNLLKDKKEELGLNRSQLQTLGTVRDNVDKAYFNTKNSSGKAILIEGE